MYSPICILGYVKTTIKHLLVFLAPNIIFIGQMEILGEASSKFNIFLQLTNKYDIK